MSLKRYQNNTLSIKFNLDDMYTKREEKEYEHDNNYNKQDSIHLNMSMFKSDSEFFSSV